MWAKRVERWRESGQTAVEFAVAHGLNPDRLRYWGWQFAKERATAAAAPPPPKAELPANAGVVVPFIEVQRAASAAPRTKPESAAPTEPIEIIAPSGLRVRVPAHFDDETLRRVLAVVR